MKKLKSLLACAFAVVLLLAALPALAQHEGHQGEMEGEMQGEMEMSAEEAAMMAAWQKSMTPGAEHERLAAMTGDYDVQIQTWMDPSAPPMVASATAHREMTMGGRVLVESVEGMVMGQNFVGHGMTGYDNVTGQYWSSWNDNMSTGLMVSYGKWDDSEGGLVMSAEVADPMTGEMKTTRMVSKVDADGTEVFTAYEKKDGAEMKSMEITYTKK